MAFKKPQFELLSSAAVLLILGNKKMSPNEIARRAADWTESTTFKLILAAIPIFLGPLIVAGIVWTGTSLVSHGNSLAKIETVVQDLKDGQTRIESAVNTHIGEIVNVQDELRSEVSALQTAERLREQSLELKPNRN